MSPSNPSAHPANRHPGGGRVMVSLLCHPALSWEESKVGGLTLFSFLMQEGDLSQRPTAASPVGPVSQTPGHVPAGQNYRRGN